VNVQDVEMPIDGTPASARVHFTAEQGGWHRFRFRVPLQDGELIAENNERETLVEVREGRQKILYLEGEPRFEVKFMRRAVADDPELQLVVLQRTAENKFLRLDVDSGDELANGFPTTREELFEYRGIVIGSLPPGFTSPKIASATAVPHSCPRYQHSKIAAAFSATLQIASGRPLNTTATIGLPVAAIASTSSFCRPTISRFARSPRWFPIQASREVCSLPPMQSTTASARAASWAASAIGSNLSREPGKR